MTVRTRFAPSPTGFMHVGNVRVAVFDWLLTRHLGGEFILRIEDTDRTRFVEGAVDDILHGLQWLGLDIDEGPYYQSQRLHLYRQYADELLASGKAYRCWCTAERLDGVRKAQQEASKPTGYDRWCRDDSHGHSPDEPHVIRFAMPNEGTTTFHDEVRGEVSFENALIDDFVMVKTDGYPTYQFANVVDDHDMRITHIIRGDEWISSTPKHVQLYKALGWEPPTFVHPPIILGPDKTKLSKRHGSVTFREYTEKGYLPDAMINFLSLLGWSPGDNREVMGRAELIEAFDLKGIVKHPAVFDTQKLDWINRQHLRLLTPEQILSYTKPSLSSRGWNPADDYIIQVFEVMKERLSTPSDLAEVADYFFTNEFDYEDKGRKWLEDSASAPYYHQLASALETVEWNLESIEAAVRNVGAELGREGGAVIHPVRIACTGRTAGPSLFEALTVLGRGNTVERLKRAGSFTEG